MKFAAASVALVCVIATEALGADSPWPANSGLKPVDVFSGGSERYHTFRIPALIRTRGGALLAFCEGRRGGRSDAGDIDLVLRRSTDNGQTWSDLQVIWDDGTNTCGNPAPVLDETTGRIWLPMTWNLGSDTEKKIIAGQSHFPRRVFMTFSNDDGVTWAEPREMPHLREPNWRWYATGPGNGIQLKRGRYAGRLLVPCNHSEHEKADEHPHRSHTIFSDDHGQSWKIGGVLEEKTNESTLVERSNGEVLDNMRSYHGRNRRAIASSTDGGESWSAVTLDEALIEPVCQASLIRWSWPGQTGAASRIVFSNPASTKRENLTLRLSLDEGKSWSVSRPLYTGLAGYSSLTPISDDQLGVLFERDDYHHLTFVAVPSGFFEHNQD